MLFVLTGDIQTGKTRWLRDLIDEIACRGVLCEGVLAPGVWRKRSDEELSRCATGEADGAVSGSGEYEKLGIENRLLPDGPSVMFGRRRDLGEGSLDGSRQSEKARLGWVISDDAIARVNEHFRKLANRSADGVLPRELHRMPFDDAGPRVSFSSDEAFLVVDELGILELKRGGGLTGALDALSAGPSRRHPHALAVVRSSLVDDARRAFEPVWGPLEVIAPDGSGRAAIFDALGI